MEFEDPSSFSFKQLVRHVDSLSNGGDVPIKIQGEIHVKALKITPAWKRKKSIWVESDLRSHDASIISTESSENLFTITIPSRASANGPSSQDTAGEACVYIESTIWVSSGLLLSSFNIQTDSLSVIFHENVPLLPHIPITVTAPQTSVNLQSSHQTFSSLRIDARTSSIGSLSGSVNGDFTLRDALSIHTLSGSININLALGPSTDGNGNNGPASLDLRTASGSIQVMTTTVATPSKIPNRKYDTSIRTNSGSIRATLVHNYNAILHSDSSSVHASLYPHGNASQRSDLSTSAMSGSTEVTVYPSLSVSADTPLRDFYASYTCLSGSLRVAYPSQWEGTVEGSTVSGHIGVQWPGLKTVDEGGGWGSKSFKGVKGTANGVLRFKAVSGSVELRGAAPVSVAEGARAVAEGVRPAEHGMIDKEDEVAQDDLETEGGSQVILTPTSEDGDEWNFVQ
ncbi:MAG: hypothetical protein Q9174_000753 [Haloplaca sp. 1 TL-2023]